jgi:hypothetical protein
MRNNASAGRTVAVEDVEFPEGEIRVHRPLEAILPDSVTMDQPSIPETNPRVTSGIHQFVAFYRTVEMKCAVAAVRGLDWSTVSFLT